jgi:hypothetical protein
MSPQAMRLKKLVMCLESIRDAPISDGSLQALPDKGWQDRSPATAHAGASLMRRESGDERATLIMS